MNAWPVVHAVTALPASIPPPPSPVLFEVGPVALRWYGLGYAVGLVLGYLLMERQARWRGLDVSVLEKGMAPVVISGFVGARLYHVIDQWDYYSAHPMAAILPPYSGLGVLGAIIVAAVVLAVLLRRWRQDFWRWADVVAPAAFLLQGFARWGNYFNQELYGPPTTMPWGLAVTCDARVPTWPCATHPFETTAFHPLFLYESVSGFLGCAVLLLIARRWGSRLRPGDLFLLWIVWYSVVRIVLESFRSLNWVVGGIPAASAVSVVLLVAALGVAIHRHRPGSSVRTWGELAADGDLQATTRT